MPWVPYHWGRPDTRIGSEGSTRVLVETDPDGDVGHPVGDVTSSEVNELLPVAQPLRVARAGMPVMRPVL